MTHEKRHRIIGIIGVLFLAAVLLLNVVIVNKTKPTSAVEVSADGTFTATGTGQGIDGPVVVQITADSSKIYSVEILQQNETQGIGSVAVEKLPGRIVEANSILVDGITGATVTSTAIKTAIRQALEKGGVDPAVFEVEVANLGPVEKTDETLECDVLVVGAGGAGLTAAVRANQQGANVLVIEKMPMVGGNSNRAEGGMNAAGTKLEEELGLLDPELGELQSTVENYIADTYRLGHDLANMDLVRTLAENSSEAIDWLGSIGAPFTDVEPTGGCKGRKYLHQPEGGEPVGEYLVTRLSKVIDEQGIEVMLNTKATELLVEDGQVVGVKAEDEAHNYTIQAKAVVLATGGFGANFELMSSYDPSLANAVTTNHSGATGDGIMMAQAIGADTVDMEQIQLHPTVIQENGLLVSESLRSKGAIIVNTEGKRFVNDLAARDVVSQAELKQPDGYCYIVFDQALVDGLSLAQKFIDRGFAISGETYEELGKNLGLSDEAVKNFVATMEKWNEDVANGEDTEWGRESLDYDLTTAPFYAIKIAPGIHHTMGGIKIDTEAQVINTDGDVIPGLFAAGETTGGIHGGNRVGGNAVCDFVVFGRIAGANAAAFAAAGEAPVEVDADGKFTATGTAKGIDGDVVVQITADADTIYSVEVIKQNETQGIGSVAVDQLPGEIVKNNSIMVDGVTGATVTSTAIKNAIRQALRKGGVDPAAFEVELAAAAPVEKTDETLECEVLVVGAGGAGLTAAVRANQEGADVLVIEKMPMVGGNSNRAEGGMNAAGTKLEEELGLLDPSLGDLQSTVENYIADTYRLGHDLANIDLVTTLAENSSEAIDWLGSIGAPFTDVEPTGGCKGRKYLHQPEGGEPVGEYLVTRLSKVIADQGIEVMLNTKATELIVENGQVVGVKAEDKEHNYTIRADAVVLATGGFGANFELMSSYDPSLANAVTTNHSGATGDGIMMAQAIGADTVDMEQIQLHPTVIQENGLLVSESLRSKGAVIVNTEGKRFVNDLAARDVVSQAELKQPDGYCYIVFDQALVDGLSLAQKFIDRGFAISGETYEELGKNIGLSDEAVQNFVATMEKWNEDVANGEDTEWGRESLDYDLTTAPFYAIKIAPGIHHTMGGIKIDTEAQVIDTAGNVIPGLFAAGETTGGIHGGNRVGGNAVCDFVVFGRIAGANAAEFAAANALAAAA